MCLPREKYREKNIGSPCVWSGAIYKALEKCDFAIALLLSASIGSLDIERSISKEGIPLERSNKTHLCYSE